VHKAKIGFILMFRVNLHKGALPFVVISCSKTDICKSESSSNDIKAEPSQLIPLKQNSQLC